MSISAHVCTYKSFQFDMQYVPTGTILSLQIGTPEVRGDSDAENPMNRQWETAMFKTPIDRAVYLDKSGIEGDQQADLNNHGGPAKAVCVYPEEHYSHWREVLEVELTLGAFGENFTTRGLMESEACIGDIYEVGTATIQVSQPRSPCWKLARRWECPDLAVKFEETGYTGWYMRVLDPGEVQAGQQLQLVERPHPEWTIDRTTNVRFQMPDDKKLAGELAKIPPLYDGWADKLRHRAETGEQIYSENRIYGPNQGTK